MILWLSFWKPGGHSKFHLWTIICSKGVMTGFVQRWRTFIAQIKIRQRGKWWKVEFQTIINHSFSVLGSLLPYLQTHGTLPNWTRLNLPRDTDPTGEASRQNPLQIVGGIPGSPINKSKRMKHPSIGLGFFHLPYQSMAIRGYYVIYNMYVYIWCVYTRTLFFWIVLRSKNKVLRYFCVCARQ